MSQPQHPLNRDRPPPAPLWVKVSGTIVLALLLVVIVLHLTGHSPIMHGGTMAPMNHSGQQP
jgi:hypothetical protein